MIIWEFKSTEVGTYAAQLSPTGYSIDGQDLDANSYRAINTGNLIDTVVSKSWAKIGFSYNYLSESEAQALSSTLLTNPMYVRLKCPLLGASLQEYEVRCSKKNLKMVSDARTVGDDNVHYTMDFNLVQKKWVTGQ